MRRSNSSFEDEFLRVNLMGFVGHFGWLRSVVEMGCGGHFGGYLEVGFVGFLCGFGRELEMVFGGIFGRGFQRKNRENSRRMYIRLNIEQSTGQV